MQDNGAGRDEAVRSARARFATVAVLILVLLLVASAYLFLPERAATLVVLACIGVLSTVGVVRSRSLPLRRVSSAGGPHPGSRLKRGGPLRHSSRTWWKACS